MSPFGHTAMMAAVTLLSDQERGYSGNRWFQPTGKRKHSGKNRDKTKAARKQKRRCKKP